MRGRQVLMETLLNHGVDRIFGNPGTTESPLLDSLPDYPGIEYIVIEQRLQKDLTTAHGIFSPTWPCY